MLQLSHLSGGYVCCFIVFSEDEARSGVFEFDNVCMLFLCDQLLVLS